MMDNDGFVDIQIILTDDFHTQQTICLTDLIYEKYVEYSNVRLDTSESVLVPSNYFKINVVYDIFKHNIPKYFMSSLDDWHILWYSLISSFSHCKDLFYSGCSSR